MKETDLMVLVSRTDGLNCQENLTVGPVFSDGDYVIISKRNFSIGDETRKNFDLLSFLETMDAITYLYFAIMTVLFLILVSISMTERNRKYRKIHIDLLVSRLSYRIRVRKYVRTFIANIWNFYDLILSQEGYYVNISMTGFLWFLFLCFIVFYTFLLVLLNHMTTEQLITFSNP